MLKASLVTAVAALALAGCAGSTGATGTQTAMSTTSSARHTVGRPSHAPPRREATPAPATTPAPEAAPPTTASTAEATPAPQPTTPATPATPATFTDAQLRSFAAAAREIQPINAQLTSGTPEQRTAATTQVRSILQRNNLDGATYNAIAAKAQAEPAFAARIASLSSSSSPG